MTPPLEQHLEKLAASVQALVRTATADGDVDKDRMLRDAEMREQRLRNEAEAHKREAKGHDREGAAAAAERQRQEGNAAAAREAKENGREEKEAEPQGAKARRLRNEIEASHRAEGEARRDLLRSEARPQWSRARPTAIAASFIGLAVLGAIGLWLVRVSPTPGTSSTLTPGQERALRPKDTFKECTNCPEMIVVPAGSFTMGSSASEPDHVPTESPQHTVTFARQFAVGEFAVTFDEWDACVADGGCSGYKPLDNGWGRGRRPVINVSWNDAKTYLAWLSRKTGKPYRLLSEAEYEFAARAGSQSAYYWGNDIGKGNANCRHCGSQWDDKQTAPVGSFAANAFGLYDMAGNVWEWVEDCYNPYYNGAPTDGSAWTSGNCNARVNRGGSWTFDPQYLRAAYRFGGPTDVRDGNRGFRVGRTLLTP